MLHPLRDLQVLLFYDGEWTPEQLANRDTMTPPKNLGLNIKWIHLPHFSDMPKDFSPERHKSQKAWCVR